MTTPTPLPPFATEDQYATFTGKPAPPGTQAQLDAVSSYIRRYCGWHIAPSLTMELVVDGPAARILMLPTLHMTAVDGISEWTGSESWTEYASADLEWSINGTVRKRRATGWTGRLSGVKATVAHGWELTEVGDITQIVLSTVARGSVNVYGLASQAVGGVSVGMSAGPGGSAGGLLLYPDQEQTLELYRLERRP